MKSILVDEEKKHCWLCGAEGPEHLDRHHVFQGSLRNSSEKYGLIVYLCHSKCHEYGRYAVHQNRHTRETLQDWAQKKAMQYYGWSMEDWLERMYKNYLL